MALLLIPPRIRFIDDNGEPLVGGKVYFYEAGTSTPKDTYQDEAATILNANPVELDARGEALIRLVGSYKIDVYDSNDVQLSGYPVDNVTEYDVRDWSGLTATIADLNSTTTTAITKNIDYSIVATDRGKTILADSSAAKVTITLLPAATATNRYRITIKKVNISDSTKPVEILGSGVETIDGVNSLNLYDLNDYVEVLCDGSNWRIVSGQIRGATLPITTATTITFDDHSRTYLCDASGGAFDFTLLPSATVGDGFQIKVKKIDSSTNAVTIKPDGSETIDDASSIILRNQHDFIWIINDGNNWYAIGEYGAEAENALPRGYRDRNGLKIEQDTGDTAHDIKINIGECRDKNDAGDLRLTSEIVKQIDANWVAGTNQGGFPSGTRSPSTWYHVFLIGKTDGTVDAGFDDAIDASTLLGVATGYTLYRRVGSVYVDASSNIKDFHQEGDLFFWIVPTSDYNTTNPGTGLITVSLSTPLNVVTQAYLNVYMDIEPGHAITTDLYMGPTFMTISGNNNTIVAHADGGTGVIHATPVILTDSSSQIHFQLLASDADTEVNISPQGWRDFIGD